MLRYFHLFDLLAQGGTVTLFVHPSAIVFNAFTDRTHSTVFTGDADFLGAFCL